MLLSGMLPFNEWVINQNTQRPCHDVGLLFFYYLQVNCRLYSGSSAYWCCCIAVFFLTQHILNTVNKLMSTYLTPMSKCKPTHDHSAATVFEQQISSVSVDLKLDLNEAAIKKHLCYKITFYWLLLFFTLKYLRERCAFFQSMLDSMHD